MTRREIGPIAISPKSLAGEPASAANAPEMRLAAHPPVDVGVDPGRDLYRRGDRWMGRFLGFHLLLGFALAPVHDTWAAAFLIGGGAAATFFVTAFVWPSRLVTRMVAGVSLQVFVALHIHQMAGMTEMHFFFFTAVTALIIYMDWRVPWPGVFAIILQHSIFHQLHNQGIHPGGLPFFESATVSDVRMGFHYGIAIAQVAIASYWAHVLHRRTVVDAARRNEVENANRLLEEKRSELAIVNDRLNENADRLEEANRELAASEGRFRSTFEQAAVGVAHVGLQGEWLRVNDRLCEITGYSREELVRLTFQDITHPHDLAADVTQMKLMLAGDISTYSMEKRYVRKDGSPVWINLTASLVRDEANAPGYFISVIEDIDVRKRAEAERDALLMLEAEARREAEAANQAKMEFLSAMSHELRTPLNAITGYADLVHMGIHGPVTEAQRQALVRIRASGAHLLGLIDEILNYAKIEAGRIDYRIEAISIAPLLRETSAMMETPLASAGVELVVRDCPSDVVALGDRDRLRQILFNLLGNAGKFTAHGGRVEVASGRSGDRAFVEVRDTGIGIAPEMRERIFDLFVQVRNTIDRDWSRQGVGLGLAISRDLIVGMGGDLTVESEVGVGSAFTILLPAAAEEDRRSGDERRTGEDRRGAERKEEEEEEEVEA